MISTSFDVKTSVAKLLNLLSRQLGFLDKYLRVKPDS
jgi:hypothetical protein